MLDQFLERPPFQVLGSGSVHIQLPDNAYVTGVLQLDEQVQGPTFVGKARIILNHDTVLKALEFWLTSTILQDDVTVTAFGLEPGRGGKVKQYGVEFTVDDRKPIEMTEQESFGL